MSDAVLRILLSLLCLIVAVGFLYSTWLAAWTAVYTSKPLILLVALLYLAFGILTLVAAGVSWVRKFVWLPRVYGLCSGFIFVILAAPSTIDEFDFSWFVSNVVFAAVLYLNWYAMKRLHSEAT